MKILTRYVLREHIGPLIFSLTALTSLLMLQFVARQLGNLVGKGLPWRVIGEFFVLSLPFTVAMTLPMAVLVSTLHAFGRMAAENEITAFKANGVRVSTLMWPVIVGAGVLALGMVAFNDQVLPRANHRLRVLQQDMSRTKPTLALNEQTLNQVTTGFYMRIGKLDRESNRMKDVTIYDLSEPFIRKTIYADSGDLAFTPNKKDLQLVLFDGYQQQLDTNTPLQLRRSYFRSQAVRVKDIGGGFEQSGSDDWKGDREKSICEMQSEYVVNAREYERVRQVYIEAARNSAKPGQKTVTVPKPRPATKGLARLYCNGLALVFRLPTAIPSVPVDQPASVAARSPGAGTGSPGAPDAGSGGATPPLSAGMQAQLDAAKAAMGGNQLLDSVDIKAAAAQAAAASNVQNQQLPTAVTTAAGDSAKSKAVAIASKPDSTAPGARPVASVNPTVTAGTPPVAVVPPPGAAVPPPTPIPTTASPVTIPVVIPGAAAVPPGTTPVIPGAVAIPPGTTPVIPGAVAIQPGTTPVIPGAVAIPPGTTPVIPGAVGGQSATTPFIPGAVAGQPTTTDSVSAAPVPVTPAVPVPAPAGPAPSLGGLTMDDGPAALNSTTAQLAIVRGSMDSLAVEIQKKFALSFACIVFVLFGPPIALRFPRGGVGATLGVSLVVFGLYYVCLMAGETLADNGKLPPFVAMWIANLIFTFAGLLLLLRIEKTADASRGGGIRAWLEERRARRSMRAVRLTASTAAP